MRSRASRMDDVKITPSKGIGNLAQAKVGMHRKSEPIDIRTGLKLKEKSVSFYVCMYIATKPRR